ncbi:MAG: Tryptophan-rich protein TspO [Phycisphaerae bacterium]|nr:Tryptophan-rich protein TspO [Phycisphaerae bacterium]
MSPAAIHVKGAGLFLLCLLVCFAPGVVGGWFKPGPWYAQLVKSPLTPPGWVFPVVWSGLYLLMAVALFLLLRSGPIAAGVAVAAGLFAAQLILNGLWSWLFFGLHRPGWAMLDLVALWTLIVASAAAFWQVRPAAGAILLPYLAWVSFAAWLNFVVWRCN